MSLDLRNLFALEPERTDALEQFLGERLCAAGVWDSPRTSDGIVMIREVEREPDHLRICGHIWEIDQTLHSFWLDLERTAREPEVAWALWYDVLERSPRRERHAVLVHDRAQEIQWRIALAGLATVRGGVLVCADAR